jgi:hypothetical protein
MKRKGLILIVALLIVSCSDSGTSPENRDFDLKFSYGIDAKNVINTFQNTYTKDLILDGTATVTFILSHYEIQQISAKMLEINFYNYPDTFVVATDSIVGVMTLYVTCDYEVKRKSIFKRLHWDDFILGMIEDSAAIKLRELNELIRNIIESKPEYLQLPPVRGGYD